MPRPGARFLLLGGDADFNVGDRAILTALARCLVDRDASAEITAVGNLVLEGAVPGVTQVIPRGLRGLPRLLRTAARADRIVVAGGGLFQDDDSRAKMPYWAALIAGLRACGTQVGGLAIGAGPLRHVESRIAARLACALLSRLSVRDRHARETLASCSTSEIEITPDPAFMLEAATPGAANALLHRLGMAPEQPLVVATIRHWFHERGGFVPNGVKAGFGIPVKRDERRFAALLEEVATALDTLAGSLGAQVLLLPGYNVAHEADDVACEALMRRMRAADVRLARLQDPSLYKAVIGRAALTVSARMHPLIFAAAMGVPFVGLSYNPKFDGLYNLLGLDARSLPLDQCPDVWGASTLIAAAESALESDVNLRARAAALAARARAQALDAAYGDFDRPRLETANA